MESLHQRLGSWAEVEDLVKLGMENKPQNDPYEDELQNAKPFCMLDEEPEVTLEWGTVC